MTSDECVELIDYQDAGISLSLYIYLYTYIFLYICMQGRKMIKTQQPFVPMLIIAFGDHDGFVGAQVKMSESVLYVKHMVSLNQTDLTNLFF